MARIRRALVLLAVFAAGCGGARTETGEPSADSGYGAVVDAGSTGSRLTVFRWQTASDTRVPEVWPVAAVDDERAAGLRCPVSDFLTSEPQTCACLERLAARAREDALRALRVSSLPPIPLRLKATAGVRRQGGPDRARIVAAADACLARSPGYAWRGAEVISGVREGFYAWVAVNHLDHRLRAERIEETHGILEIGGWSAQIAYRVPGPLEPAPPRGEVIALTMGPRTVHVYSLSDELGEDAAVSAIGSGARLPAQCAAEGDPDACLSEKIDAFLCGTSAKGPGCRDAEWRPAHHPEMRFVGLSTVAHVARNLGAGTDASFDDVRARAVKVCGPGSDKRGVRDALFRAVPPRYRERVCFDAFYAARLAREGWDVPLERLRQPDPRWAGEPSWALGAVVMEAAARAPDAGVTARPE